MSVMGGGESLGWRAFSRSCSPLSQLQLLFSRWNTCTCWSARRWTASPTKSEWDFPFPEGNLSCRTPALALSRCCPDPGPSPFPSLPWEVHARLGNASTGIAHTQPGVVFLLVHGDLGVQRSLREPFPKGESLRNVLPAPLDFRTDTNKRENRIIFWDFPTWRGHSRAGGTLSHHSHGS